MRKPWLVTAAFGLLLMTGTVDLGAIQSCVPIYQETFETYDLDWQSSGSGFDRDCVVAKTGCSLRCSPPEGAHASTSHEIDVDLSATRQLRLWVRPSAECSDTDANLFIYISDGSYYVAHFSNIICPNTGISVTYYPAGGGSTSTGTFFYMPVGTLPTEGWTRFSMVFYADNPSVRAAASTSETGTPVTFSSSLPHPGTDERITELEFTGDSWSGYTSQFNFDDLQICN